mmetsp:Transcript_9756/g.14781  ORF Transcript_9756/g.14781 Transcript_9756/m.14781 type:complete len:231 (-) Transcript_9756:67-759(-)
MRSCYGNTPFVASCVFRCCIGCGIAPNARHAPSIQKSAMSGFRNKSPIPGVACCGICAFRLFVAVRTKRAPCGLGVKAGLGDYSPKNNSPVDASEEGRRLKVSNVPDELLGVRVELQGPAEGDRIEAHVAQLAALFRAADPAARDGHHVVGDHPPHGLRLLRVPHAVGAVPVVQHEDHRAELEGVLRLIGGVHLDNGFGAHDGARIEQVLQLGSEHRREQHHPVAAVLQR